MSIRANDAGNLRPCFVVSQMAAEISEIMMEEGVSLEELLAGLDEAGEEIFRETYGNRDMSL